MKNATLHAIVTDFMAAVPAVITSARSRNGGACAFCDSPRGVQHTEECPLWGLIDARISYRVAAESPTTGDVGADRLKFMKSLEGGGTDLIMEVAPTLALGKSTASDEGPAP